MNKLLEDVRMDAFRKAEAAEGGDRLVRLVGNLLILAMTARKEGLLALEEKAEELEKQAEKLHDNFTTVMEGVTYVADGMEEEVILDILTARYWRRNVSGIEALMEYLAIGAIAKIPLGEEIWKLEKWLMAHLTEKEREKYLEERHHYIEEKKVTPLEEMLSSENTFEDPEINCVKSLLEEQIQKASDEKIRGVLEKMDEGDIVCALRGLSIAAKKKICYAVSRRAAESYAESDMYMGPLRCIDILERLAAMLAGFRKAE